jgi:hypothetical protein
MTAKPDTDVISNRVVDACGDFAGGIRAVEQGSLRCT